MVKERRPPVTSPLEIWGGEVLTPILETTCRCGETSELLTTGVLQRFPLFLFLFFFFSILHNLCLSCVCEADMWWPRCRCQVLHALLQSTAAGPQGDCPGSYCPSSPSAPPSPPAPPEPQRVLRFLRLKSSLSLEFLKIAILRILVLSKTLLVEDF